MIPVLDQSSSRLPVLVACVLAVVAVLVVGVPGIREWHRQHEQQIIYEQVVRQLRSPHWNEEGYWVGDITELYRLGEIPRELAEADTAPLSPLVPQPVPFHGHYVRSLVSGPPMHASDDTPESFLGRKRVPKNFALCIYPAEPGPGKWVWIMHRLGVLRKDDGIPPS